MHQYTCIVHPLVFTHISFKKLVNIMISNIMISNVPTHCIFFKEQNMFSNKTDPLDHEQSNTSQN